MRATKEKKTMADKLLIGALVFIVSCSMLTKENARTALNEAQAVCITTHVFEPVEAVQVACGLLDVSKPWLDSLLSHMRPAVAKAAKAQAAKEAKGSD